MSITYSDVTKSVGDQLVDGLKQLEERSVSAITTLSDAASKLMPELRTSYPSFGSLPSASEVVAANFAFAERLLKAQRETFLGVLEAVPSFGDAAPAKKKVASKA